MTLPELVRATRGETAQDPRPNKALRPQDYPNLLRGYRHMQFLVEAATHGLQPSWDHVAQPQESPPPNHQSANRYLPSVARSVRSGQDEGQYLVLDMDILSVWPQVQSSPFGAVEKKGIDPSEEIRLVHDLSFPRGASVNTATLDINVPDVEYLHVAAIAQRIEQCYDRYPGKEIKTRKADVKGAYRHLRLTSSSVHWTGASIPQFDALVIDVSAPFG